MISIAIEANFKIKNVNYLFGKKQKLFSCIGSTKIDFSIPIHLSSPVWSFLMDHEEQHTNDQH